MRCFLDVDVEYLEEFNNNLPFLPERMKIGKVEKPLPSLHDKKEIWYTYKKFEIKPWIGI